MRISQGSVLLLRARPIWRLGICIVIPLLLASCANVRGIPAGLTDENQTNLASQDLQKTFSVALALQATYRNARDDNLNYVYWSSVPFFPIAAAAAGAIYGKHNSRLASIGIAAGTLVGFNSFTNARANAKAYESGIVALACVYRSLSGYSNRQSDASSFKDDAETLNSTLIPAAQSALSVSQSLNLNAGDAQAERAANPTVMSSLSTAEKSLTQAISDAQSAATGARNEKSLFDNLSAFGASNITQIDTIVAAKVTVADVNYSTLLTSISGYTNAPKSPTTPSTTGAGTPSAEPKKMAGGAVPAAPIADAIKTMQSSISQLQQATSALTDKTSKFGLTAREQEVAACIKNI